MKVRMASDRGKRKTLEQSAGGSTPHHAKSARVGDPAQRSQTRKMRSTRKENAAVIEQCVELDATVTEDGTSADGRASKQHTRSKSAHSVKQECKQKIIAEMGQIVTGLIEKAKRGSYNEAKLLLTIAEKDEGKKAEDKAAQAAADASLAELLLGHLGAAPKRAAPVKKRGGRRKTAGSSTKAGAVPLPEEPVALAAPDKSQSGGQT
jgi:hypothetical protein